MQALHKVPDMAEYGWIIPEEAILTMLSREYAWSNFHRVLNMPQVLNMPGLGIWQGYEKMRVTHSVKYTWISLNIFFKKNKSHSFLGWIATTRLGDRRKRNTKRLKHTRNLFRKNLKLISIC